MRFFLYTYDKSQNYAISQRAGVFGAKMDATGLGTKIKQLRQGDLILIRNGNAKHSLEFFGYCMVCGKIFDHDSWSPFRDLLWSDEIVSERVIYPFRVVVNFEDIPQLSLDKLTWRSLDELGFYNSRGDQLCGRQAWGKKFMGNFIEKPRELDTFSRLIGLTPSDITQSRPIDGHSGRNVNGGYLRLA